MSKPREFWVYPSKNVGTGLETISVKPLADMPAILRDNTVGIHVIEYSAYEALEKKNAKQMEWIERKREHLTNHDAITLTIHKKTLEENKIMREALEKIYHLDLSAGEQMWDIAEAIVGSPEPTTGHVKSNECYRKECDGNHVEAEDEKATLPIDVMSTANLTGSSGTTAGDKDD